jgi:hypothetical protein
MTRVTRCVGKLRTHSAAHARYHARRVTSARARAHCERGDEHWRRHDANGHVDVDLRNAYTHTSLRAIARRARIRTT